jgi:hypothetical protein
MNNQSFITRIVLRTGLAKSEKQVPAVLIAITALAFVVMFIIWPRNGQSDRVSPAEFISIASATHNA